MAVSRYIERILRMTQIAAIFLTVLILMSFIRMYLDWSRFEKSVRRENFVDIKAARKIALKIGLSAAIAGLSISLMGVIVRLSTPFSSPEEIDNILYLAYVISCTVGWTFLVVLAFILKVLTLRSIYTERPPE
jgi:hypothetical protein